jgi:copper(I)-binding protein
MELKIQTHMGKSSYQLLLLVLAAFLLNACTAGSPETHTEENGIEVHTAIMSAAAQHEDSPVFLGIDNHGSVTDQLTGVTTTTANSTGLYNGEQAVDVIPVYANTEFVFVPDGYHVMLWGLKHELQVGDEIELVLHFRDHEDITVTVSVQESMEHQHGEH